MSISIDLNFKVDLIVVQIEQALDFEGRVELNGLQESATKVTTTKTE